LSPENKKISSPMIPLFQYSNIPLVIGELGRGEMAAKGPPLETRGVAEQENLPFFRLHLEIVMAQCFGVYPTLKPPVQDFHDLVSLSQMNKRPGLSPLCIGVGFHFDILKDPFFSIFFSHRDTEKKTENEMEGWNIENQFFVHHSIVPLFHSYSS
jgi:hypothetical protein